MVIYNQIDFKLKSVEAKHIQKFIRCFMITGRCLSHIESLIYSDFDPTAAYSLQQTIGLIQCPRRDTDRQLQLT